jgi:hypothetical protein
MIVNELAKIVVDVEPRDIVTLVTYIYILIVRF